MIYGEMRGNILRKILFRAKSIDKYKKNEWVEGYVFDDDYENGKLFVGSLEIQEYKGTACDDWDIVGSCFYEVDQNTVCQYTEQDIEENKIWENDILEYDGDGCARCIGVVKYGNYIQDGSGGEYSGRECIGFYVEMVRLIPYEWEDESVEEILEYFPYYYKKYSLAEILKQKDVKKVGNIFDNPELLEEK